MGVAEKENKDEIAFLNCIEKNRIVNQEAELCSLKLQ